MCLHCNMPATLFQVLSPYDGSPQDGNLTQPAGNLVQNLAYPDKPIKRLFKLYSEAPIQPCAPETLDLEP